MGQRQPHRPGDRRPVPVVDAVAGDHLVPVGHSVPQRWDVEQHHDWPSSFAVIRSIAANSRSCMLGRFDRSPSTISSATATSLAGTGVPGGTTAMIGLSSMIAKPSSTANFTSALPSGTSDITYAEDFILGTMSGLMCLA